MKPVFHTDESTTFSKYSHMRHDPFPVIETLDDVLPTIEANPGIRAFRHGDYIVVRYLINSAETFQTRMDLECRGLIFEAASGWLLSRPISKFFNMLERETPATIDYSRPGRMMEKLDGSMIGAFVLKGALFFHTRGGVTDPSRKALADARANEIEASRWAFNQGLSINWEWTSPENRIVLDYGQPRLTLLTLRDRRTGAYMDDVAEDLAKRFDLHRPEVLYPSIASEEDLKAILSDMKDREGIEGGVIEFPDGHRLKVKALPYLARHKVISQLHQEKHAVRCVVDQIDDDVIPSLHEDQAEFLKDYASRLHARLRVVAEDLRQIVGKLENSSGREAHDYLKSNVDPITGRIIIQVRKGKVLDEVLYRAVSAECQTEARREKIMSLFDIPRWEPPRHLFVRDS